MNERRLRELKEIADGDNSAVVEAVWKDPAVNKKDAGMKAMREIIRVYGDVLPQFLGKI